MVCFGEEISTEKTDSECTGRTVTDSVFLTSTTVGFEICSGVFCWETPMSWVVAVVIREGVVSLDFLLQLGWKYCLC